MKKILFLVLTAQLAFSQATYYVKTNGNDALSGTSPANAWATITKAANTAFAGDRVLVFGGEYAEQLAPLGDGLEGAYIKFEAYQAGWRPILRPSSGRSVQLTGRKYIWVEGFALPRGFDIDGGANHNVFYNDSCAFDATAKTRWYPVGEFGDCNLNRATRCLFNHNDGLDAGYGSGCGVGMYSPNGTSVDDNLVDSCMSIQSADAGYSTFGWQGFNRNYFRADTAMWNHTAFLVEDGVSAHQFVLDHCVAIQNGINSASRDGTARENGHAYEILGQGGLIMRYNLAVDDTMVVGTHQGLDGWYVDELSISPDFEGPEASPYVYADARDCFIYNCTVWGRSFNPEQRYLFSNENWRSYTHTRNVNIRNCIFARETNSPRMTYERDAYDYAWQEGGFDNRFTGNMFFRTTGDGIGTVQDGGGILGPYTIAEMESRYPWRWSGNTLAYPKFVDTTARGRWINLNLQIGSPAIDAAVPLTYTASAGSGTSVTVEEAGWFWGGNELVIGDSIMLGTQKRQIASISGNTLNLTASATWLYHDGLYYYNSHDFVGNAPDLGALEAQASLGPDPTLPTGTFSVTPTVISGATSCTFSWSSSNATSASIAPTIGSVATSGSTSTMVSSTTTYTLTLTNDAGSRQYTATVTLSGGGGSAANVLVDGRFELAQAWNFYSDGTGCSYARTSSSPIEGSWSGQVTIGSSLGTNTQLYQYDLTLQPGVLYHLAMKAKANSATSMWVSLGQHGAPYANYGLADWQCSLTGATTDYTTAFVSTNGTTVNDGRLMFWFVGGTANRTITIDTVYLYRDVSALTAPDLTAPAEGASCQTATPALAWSSVTGATKYVIQAATDAGFTSVVYQDSILATTPTWGAHVLPYASTIYWHVQAVNDQERTAWSTARSFSTGSRAYLAPIRKARIH